RGPGRDLFAELEFDGNDGLGHGHVIARRVAVAGEDRADHGRVALAAAMVAGELDLPRAIADLRRAGAFVGESGPHPPGDPLGLALRRRGGADGTGGGAVEMHLRLSGLPRHHRHRGFEVLDATGHVGIVAGTAGIAVAVVVHGPHVVAVAREYVHERVLALARHGEIIG